ncbi:MAG TPA: hypothetical protein VF735_11760 [Pyrinomonadaceae bacterium]|jgi:predicted DNA binding protein
MRIKGFIIPALMLVALWPVAASAGASLDDQAEVRGAVRQAFAQLKSRQYGALYDALPSASQRRVSRERFINSLRRTGDIYELTRMETGAVRVSGDIAVVDTVMYGRVSRPLESDGKVVAQLYLVREGGRWRVVVSDRATAQSLLADYPAFIRKYPPREPRAYVKRDGRWVDLTSALRRAARR